MLTLTQYLGPYARHADATATIQTNALQLIDKVNQLYTEAYQDGCELPSNPATGSQISGSGNGGFRPLDSPVGAANSTHKQGRGVDTYDPQRQFASWCLAHPEELLQLGLFMEDPRWTPTWVHLQDQPPGSRRTVYVPSQAPALASLPPVWDTA